MIRRINVLTCFKVNSVKANPKKLQLMMILGKSRRPNHNLLINLKVIKNSAQIKLFGLTINNKLSFENILQDYTKQSHTNSMHSDKQEKYLILEKLRVLGNAFVKFQFYYERLIWMFCKKSLYFKMKKIHHKTLSVIHQSDESYG